MACGGKHFFVLIYSQGCFALLVLMSSLRSVFGYFFIKEKVTGPRPAKRATM